MSKKSTSSSKKNELQELQEQANPQPATVADSQDKKKVDIAASNITNTYLVYEEIFYIVKDGPQEYLKKGSEPIGPFTRGGLAVTVDVWTMESTATQQVQIDTANTINDVNQNPLPLVVGGRPSSRRRK